MQGRSRGLAPVATSGQAIQGPSQNDLGCGRELVATTEGEEDEGVASRRSSRPGLRADLVQDRQGQGFEELALCNRSKSPMGFIAKPLRKACGYWSRRTRFQSDGLIGPCLFLS